MNCCFYLNASVTTTSRPFPRNDDKSPTHSHRFDYILLEHSSTPTITINHFENENHSAMVSVALHLN